MYEPPTFRFYLGVAGPGLLSKLRRFVDLANMGTPADPPQITFNNKAEVGVQAQQINVHGDAHFQSVSLTLELYT